VTLVIPADLEKRWHTGDLVGAAQPVCAAAVRRGHFSRGYADDGHWQATWTPTTDWQDLPNVAQFELEQSFDQNGIAVGTFDIDNVEYVDAIGAGGTYRKIQRGWYSPLRSYNPPGKPGPDKAHLVKNEWDRTLGIVAEVKVEQGYGDATIQTYGGLLDSTTVSPLPDKLRLASRDFGQVLVDSKLFGWNIDPKLRDPLQFWDKQRNRALERSGDSLKREAGRNRHKAWVLVDDVAELVTTVCRWAGWQKGDLRISDTGARLKEPVQFSYSDTYSAVIQKACDLTGYQFFISAPSAAHPQGRPTFRRPRSAVAFPPVAVMLRDDKLLTGLNWQTTDEPKASIYRVRGKNEPTSRGGRGLGHIRTPAVMSVYRPPWHVAIDGTQRAPTDRDARILKHVIQVEPLYKTQHEVDVAAQMWALASALAATTATLEIPCFPALELDDVVTARDLVSGLNTRCWIAHRTETFTGGKETKWVQSLGVSCLDDPDVVGVVADLHATLTGLPSRGLS
jgi:hypothetical protein